MLIPSTVGGAGRATSSSPARQHPVHAQRHRDQRGKFRVRGDTVELCPPIWRTKPCASSSSATRSTASPGSSPLTGNISWRTCSTTRSFPPSSSSPGRQAAARRCWRSARNWRSASPGSRSTGKLLEAQRIKMRTEYDLEMMREMGFCSGHRELLPPPHRPRARRHGPTPCSTSSRPDYLLVIDESTPRSPDRRHVRGRPGPQDGAGGARLPPAQRARQPPLRFSGVHASARVPGQRHPRLPFEIRTAVGTSTSAPTAALQNPSARSSNGGNLPSKWEPPGRRADRPPDRPARPRSHSSSR
jgi:hypothetical protein